MTEHQTESVLIPGVTVSASIEPSGEPLVMILTSGDGAGQATIHVTARGISEGPLCALLRVVATTIEERRTRSGQLTSEVTDG